MTELAPVTAQAELHKTPLAPQPREFGASDVVSVQAYLQELHDSSVTEGSDYVPGATSMYNKLTEVEASFGVEPQANEDSFDKSVSSLLSAWGERVGLPGGAPKTLTEAKEIFSANPKLNDESPIHFQGGAEYASGRFVHVATGRAMGKHRETPTHRYYLNPTTDKMGHVVEQLTGAALESGVPLYFKFVNVATGKPDQRTLARTDRVVIYASEAQTGFVEDLLGQVSAENPEAFAGRTVAGFGESIADGITRADDVTKEQNNRFKGQTDSTSFNDLRSKLIYEATIDVTKDLLAFPDYATSIGAVTEDGESIRSKFASELSKAISERQAGTVINENDPLVVEAFKLGLSSEKLEESGKFGEAVIRDIKNCIGKTARDVLPRVKPDDLLPGYKHRIHVLAPKYGIDPDNLAKNISLAA